jgi:DNA-binding NtrC family response regulator
MNEETTEQVWTALVVEDTAGARRVVVEKLRSLPLRVFQATDLFDALVRFAEVRPDVVITDLRMPGGDGIELLGRIREFTDVPVVILTSYPSIGACEQAMLAGAQRFLDWREGIDELPRVTLELLQGRERRAFADVPQVASIRGRRHEDFRAHLERLLRECQGNIAMVAERLQKDRSTVTYHLKKLGLFDPERHASASERSTEPRTEFSD